MAISEKILGYFGWRGKSAPEYGKDYSSDYYKFGPSFYHRHSSLDYDREVGHLDCHSLFMAVANYIGTRLPEATPIVQKRTKDNKGKEVMETVPLHPLSQLIRRPNRHFIWA